jgi:hypothetical protein
MSNVITQSDYLGIYVIRYSYKILSAISGIIIISLVQGCYGVTSGLPPKLYDDEASLSAPNDTLAFASIPKYVASAGDPTIARNTFISLRMYSIDIEYSKYEARLTAETEGTNLAGELVNLGLTGTASVIPAGETTKVLSAAATAVTGANAAINKDLLLSQTIQSLQTQMRADRSAQAAKMIASMQCSITDYPIGLALSDLEEYYRSGTIASAQVNLNKTVNAAETNAKAKKDAASPSKAVSAQGSAELNAGAASTKAAASVKSATNTGCNHS